MSPKRTMIQLILACIACSRSGVSAQAPKVGAVARESSSIAGDSVKAVRQFVQDFYTWYTPLAVANHGMPAWYNVLSKSDQYLDRELAAAIRADSIARE